MSVSRTLLVVCLSLLVSGAPAALAQSRTKRPRRPPAAKKPTPPKAPEQTPVEQAAVTTASGLTYVITKRGGGRKPQAGETVLVHYTGTLTNGTKFDSSHDRNDPIAFPIGMGRVIKGWDEGIAQLGIGDHAVLVIPPAIGYGARGAGGVIPPNATLVFVVELVDIKASSLSQVLMKTVAEKGVAAAVAQYRELKAAGFGDVYTAEGELNGVGYGLLQQNRAADAIEIFKLNVEAYPSSANVYDSLGEAYMVAGDKALAIESYQKSLDRDPRNQNAAEMLKKLKAQ